MAFHSCHDGWSASFVNSDGKTPVGPIRSFRSDEALRLTIERRSGLGDLESKHMLDLAIAKGRGAVWLNLTSEQYRKLMVKGREPPGVAR